MRPGSHLKPVLDIIWKVQAVTNFRQAPVKLCLHMRIAQHSRGGPPLGELLESLLPNYLLQPPRDKLPSTVLPLEPESHVLHTHLRLHRLGAATVVHTMRDYGKESGLAWQHHERPWPNMERLMQLSINPA